MLHIYHDYYNYCYFFFVIIATPHHSQASILFRSFMYLICTDAAASPLHDHHHYHHHHPSIHHPFPYFPMFFLLVHLFLSESISLSPLFLRLGCVPFFSFSYTRYSFDPLFSSAVLNLSLAGTINTTSLSCVCVFFLSSFVLVCWVVHLGCCFIHKLFFFGYIFTCIGSPRLDETISRSLCSFSVSADICAP